MSQVAILVRHLPDGSPSPFTGTLRAAGFDSTGFSTVEEFQDLVRGMLMAWLAADAAPEVQTANA